MKRAAILVYLLSACAAVDDVDGLDATGSALGSENLLSSNLLSSNNLSLNLLSSNLLSSNLLSSNRLVLNTKATGGLEQSDGGRELLRYIARCALGRDMTLEVSVEGVSYVFPGLLGLAPEWARQPIATPQKRLVSGCLLSHVNAFGISVPISVRTVGKLTSAADEKVIYPAYEASFYGNVLDGKFEAYACGGDDPMTAMELSSYRSLRVCSDAVTGGTTSACGFQVTGRCAAVCDLTRGGPKSCRTGAEATAAAAYYEVVNVWLQQ